MRRPTGSSVESSRSTSSFDSRAGGCSASAAAAACAPRRGSAEVDRLWRRQLDTSGSYSSRMASPRKMLPRAAPASQSRAWLRRECARLTHNVFSTASSECSWRGLAPEAPPMLERDLAAGRSGFPNSAGSVLATEREGEHGRGSRAHRGVMQERRQSP